MGDMQDILPEPEYEAIEKKQLESDVRKQLESDVQYLNENGLDFWIGAFDFRSFMKKIRNATELETVTSSQREAKIEFHGIKQLKRTITVRPAVGIDIGYGMERDVYGFRDIQCKHCGRTNLFFNQKETIYYCPVCG
jgi:hypothetical protein